MTLTRSDLGPHARETAAVRARPDGHNRAWGFVWRNARFIMRPSKHMPASVGRSSPPRPAAPSTAPLRSTGGGIISIENNRQTGGRTERERGDLSIDRPTDSALTQVCIAVTRPAASTNSIRQSLQGICTISCIAGEIPPLARSEIRARMTGRGDHTPRR